MDFSRLSSNDRTAAIASAIVVVLGIVSLINDWGAIMLLPIIAGIGMLVVLLLPQLSPTSSMPAPKGLLMLATGGAAALFWLLAAITWLDWITGHLGAFDTLQFLVGLVASLVMAWAGWQAFQAGGGTLQSAATPATPMPQAGSVPPPESADDNRQG